MEEYIRTEFLLGKSGVERLWKQRVIIFGIGGVGGYVAEALARSGIGHLTLVDNDVVSISNINRQIIALHSTVGRYKTEVMRERIQDMNPKIEVEVKNCFFLPETRELFDFTSYDYVVDAVDTVTAKLAIIEAAKEAEIPVVSSMGAGNKLDPTKFRITDISKTSVCPLAKVMRRELRARNIKDVKVVFSTEAAIPLYPESKKEKDARPIPGSIAFVPAVAGLLLAGEVVKDLIKKKEYHYLLFDLDGTLTNSEEGITKSAQYALKELGIEEENRDVLRKFIGPPLLDSFREFYHMDDACAAEAVRLYRERYSDVGMFENEVYMEIPNLLAELREKGYYLAVATSKPLVFTEQILKHFKLWEFFDFVSGPDLEKHLQTKADVIRYVREENKIKDRDQILMIGDRKHDILGAKENGIDSLGVLYGFGGREELEKCGATYIVETVKALRKFLLEPSKR